MNQGNSRKFLSHFTTRFAVQSPCGHVSEIPTCVFFLSQNSQRDGFVLQRRQSIPTAHCWQLFRLSWPPPLPDPNPHSVKLLFFKKFHIPNSPLHLSSIYFLLPFLHSLRLLCLSMDGSFLLWLWNRNLTPPFGFRESILENKRKGKRKLCFFSDKPRFDFEWALLKVQV